MLVHFNVSSGRRCGKVIKSNAITVWVKLMIGARTHKIIKRHRIKHDVIEVI